VPVTVKAREAASVTVELKKCSSHNGAGAAPAAPARRARQIVAVEVDHPMEVGHHVSRIAVTNPRDPIPTKGEFLFSPANGQAYVAFPARLDDGPSAVRVDVECSAGVRWSATGSTRVVDGSGGCGGEPLAPIAGATGRARLSPPGPGRSAGPGAHAARPGGEVRAPVIRVPGLLRGHPLEPGQIVEDQWWGGVAMWAVGGAVDMLAVLVLVWRFLATAERASPAGPVRPTA
jgi:hypothetical protein